MTNDRQRDEAPLPDWDRELRAQAGSSVAEVTPISEALFTQTLVGVLNAKGVHDVVDRVRYSAARFEKEYQDDALYDEFRALVHAGCVWWGVFDVMPTPAQYAAYAQHLKLKGEDATVMNTDRRTFRHAWAGYHYLLRREPKGKTPTIESGYYRGSKAPLKGDLQDAFVALIRAIVDEEDPAIYWDINANRIRASDTPSGPAEPGIYANVLEILTEGSALLHEATRRPARSYSDLGDILNLFEEITTTQRRFLGLIYDRRTVAEIRRLTDVEWPTIVGPVRAFKLRRIVRRYQLSGTPRIKDTFGALSRIPFQDDEWNKLATDKEKEAFWSTAPWAPEGSLALLERWRAMLKPLDRANKALGLDALRDLQSRPIADMLRLLRTLPDGWDAAD